MSKIKYIISLLAAVAFLSGCNESLEDTYSDYAGNGKIRYVAKCSDLDATPGWERLILEWKNGTDATVDKIKIVWTCEDQKDSVLLPNNSTSYVMENLPDGNYRLDICAMDKYGHQSLGETTYGRPYTRDHEIMRAFTRGVLKSYFVNEKLIFFTDKWNENIVEIKLQYKGTDGKIHDYVFDTKRSQTMAAPKPEPPLGDYNNFITLPNVSMDPKDTVYVFRKGKLEGCPDTLQFDPYVVSRHKTFSAGFVNAIERRYGYSTETKEEEAVFLEFVENATELELDYNIETLEDILYCNSLKTLVVGKNRYQSNAKMTKSEILNNPEKSKLVVDKAAEAEILGLRVKYYSPSQYTVHYFGSPKSYMDYMGKATLPSDLVMIDAEELKAYDEEGNKVRCDLEGTYAKMNNLVDNNPATWWEPVQSAEMRTYQMQMQLKEPTSIRGIKIAQVAYNYETGYENYPPSVISIQTSLDGAVWENVTYFETNELGRDRSEVTLLPIPEKEGSRQVQYIKFSLHDSKEPTSNLWNVWLGDIVLYK